MPRGEGGEAVRDLLGLLTLACDLLRKGIKTQTMELPVLREKVKSSDFAQPMVAGAASATAMSLGAPVAIVMLAGIACGVFVQRVGPLRAKREITRLPVGSIDVLAVLSVVEEMLQRIEAFVPKHLIRKEIPRIYEEQSVTELLADLLTTDENGKSGLGDKELTARLRRFMARNDITAEMFSAGTTMDRDLWETADAERDILATLRPLLRKKDQVLRKGLVATSASHR
jgi:hypothetical protein